MKDYIKLIIAACIAFGIHIPSFLTSALLWDNHTPINIWLSVTSLVMPFVLLSYATTMIMAERWALYLIVFIINISCLAFIALCGTLVAGIFIHENAVLSTFCILYTIMYAGIFITEVVITVRHVNVND